EHADEAGGAGKRGTDQEAQRDEPAEQDADDQEHHRADDGDGGVLARQVGRGALLDGGGDLAHAGRARVGRHQGVNGVRAVGYGEQPAKNDRPHDRVHGLPLMSARSLAVWAVAAPQAQQRAGTASPAPLASARTPMPDLVRIRGRTMPNVRSRCNTGTSAAIATWWCDARARWNSRLGIAIWARSLSVKPEVGS